MSYPLGNWTLTLLNVKSLDVDIGESATNWNLVIEKVPPGSFGHVPTPAIVAPIELTVSRENYIALGRHEKSIREMSDVLLAERVRHLEHKEFYTQWQALL